MSEENAAETRHKQTFVDKLREIRLPLWVSLVLLVLLLVVFAWQRIAVGAAERRLAVEKQALTEQSAAAQAAFMAQAREALARHSEANHVLFGNALAWAVRGEMIRNNRDQIDQYFTELVRNERIRLVLLADVNGKILLASNRKLQEGTFADVFPAALLQEPQVTVQEGEGNEKRLVLPIQGLTARLGTVVVVYLPEALPEG